ncbi:MAG: TetR/AcrR family transcriptional regulator [Clostridiaceae bacterium]|nr:TetR/AcrR family transcriptional regulator [Clostridiaceae bacterium]MBW4860892.1 TetR/AcrR family transcriptional regulator [Clostridiaceae bacterium]MBW4867517.1 TetR/AcrR family transcriptional regulator [Clostridiaceae bacterium]
MIEKITNHIAIQSQEWFANSLLELMEEKKFSNITITEIAAKADLSRRTFYRIFETKIDILVYYTDKLYDEFLELLKLESNPHFTAIIRLYFEFWYQNKHFLELLRRSEMLPFMMNQYTRMFPKVFQIIKGNHPLAHNADALSYAMAFSAGGLLSILLKWAEDGMNKTPEEIMKLMELIFPYSL